MPHTLFNRTATQRFFHITVFIMIALYATATQATVIIKQNYLLKGAWPLKTSFWQLDEPAGLAADSRGYLYIADRTSDRVLKFTPDGRLAEKWGSQGNAPGEFQSPSGIAVDSERGFVYVADTNNHRIQQFTLYGDFLHEWGASGQDQGQFDHPHGVSVDQRGFVYVADTDNHRIQKFTPHGEFVSQWGTQGSGPAEFESPQGITVHGNDVYVADTGNYRVQQFNASGQYIHQWGGKKRFAAPAGITVGSDGLIYVADKDNTENPSLMKFTPQGDVIYTAPDGSEIAMPMQNISDEFKETLKIWSPQNTGLQNPEGVAAGPDGLIYVADTGNGRIVRLAETGRKIGAFDSAGGAGTLFDAPRVITCDAGGNIYIGDKSEDRFLKYTGQGAFVNAPLDMDTYPSGAVIDADGNFYLADAENNRVLKYDASGNPVSDWGGSVQFDTPRGLAIDPQGFIYVADSGNNRVCKLAPETGTLEKSWGESGSGNGQFNQPADIAITPNGRIYVTDSGNQRVQVFESNGQFLREWKGFDYPQRHFENPQGIAADANGYIYVTDTGTGQVFKFSPWGYLIAEIGTSGNGPGNFKHPADVIVDNQGRVIVADTARQNVQIFENEQAQSPGCGRQRAIIIAGSEQDDPLWENIQMCANLAYNALLHRGFTAETIRYLSANTDLDLNDDGRPDVHQAASNESVENALKWAGEAESIVIYMVDHGGTGTFRLNSNEILRAADMNTWLADKPAAIIYDACQSASFKDTLAGLQRLFIASADHDQNAGFAGYAAHSFSNFFWSDMMVGKSVTEAFKRAKGAMQAVYENQTPVMKGSFTFCQGGGSMGDDQIPEIKSVETDAPITDSHPTLDGTSKAAIIAHGVTDDKRIKRVYAVIQPPRYETRQVRNPVLNLPTVDLLPTDESGKYQADWKRFSMSGQYDITVFAVDNAGLISKPQTAILTVENPVSSKAILIAGFDDNQAELDIAIDDNIRAAYNALGSQGYAPEDIYVLSADEIVEIGKIKLPVENNMKADSPIAPTSDNVAFAVKQWAAGKTQDVLIYLTGKGEKGEFHLNADQMLKAVDLDIWLDQLQENINGIATVVYDACYSGSFLKLMTPPENRKRIVITSTPAGRCSLLQSGEGTGCDNVTDHSFSAYFWEGVQNGLNVGQAFDQARRAVETLTSLLKGGLIEPQLDDNGNGIGNESQDGVLAGSHYIGAGIELVDDGPIISAVSEPQTLADDGTEATLWAAVTATAGVSEVWAVITPPDYQMEAAAAAIMNLVTVPLDQIGDTDHYEYKSADDNEFDFDKFGIYGITIHARDKECNVSLPASTRVDQTQYADCYREIQVGDQVHSFWSGDCDSARINDAHFWSYTFTIDESQKVSINLKSNAENAVLYLLDENGNVIGPLNGDPQQIIEALAPGTYTIEVITTDNPSQDYNLEVQLADPLPPKGTLQVTIEPEEAIADGAQWRTDGGEWRNSASVHSGLAMGEHTVMFKKLSGWVRPDSVKIEITEEEGIAVSGEYKSATEIFAAAYGGDDDETMTASALLNDGSLIATGYVDSSDGRDLWIVKLSPTGQIQKQFTYGGAGEDMGWSVDATPDKGAVIAGVTPSADGDRDIVVLKLDEDANVLWKKTYDGSGLEDHPSIRSKPNGGYILAAESDSFTPGYKAIWATELNPAGEIEWQYAYLYNQNNNNIGNATMPKAFVVPDADASDGYSYIIATVGKFENADNSDFWVIKLNEDGGVEWQKTYGGVEDETDPRIIANNGGYILAGTSRSVGPGYVNIWLGQLEPDPVDKIKLKWQKAIGESDNAHRLANLSSDINGGQIVASNRYDGNITLFKLAADGNIPWQQNYAHEESGALTACNVHPYASDGNDVRYMVASNRLQGQNDYFLFRMEANGSLPGCTMETESELQIQTEDLPPATQVGNVFVYNADISPVSDHFTVMAWIKVNQNGSKANNVIFWSEDQKPIIEVDASGRIKFGFKPNGTAPPLPGEQAKFGSSQTIAEGDWAHVACTWDGQFYKGYVNGQSAGEIELPYFDLGSQILIGQDDGPGDDDPLSRNFDGLIDEVRIYAEALSEDRIAKAMQSNCQLSDSGMAAHWQFDYDFKDEVSGQSGTEHGAAAFFEGRNGQAAAFDGIDDYLDYGDLPNTDFTGENPFTVSMWVKDGSVGRMISRWRYYFRIRENQIRFEFKKSKGEQDLNPLITPIPSNWINDGWNHLAFVYGGEDGQRAIYINGVLPELDGTKDHAPFSSTYPLKPLKIGKSDHLGGKYFAGLLDDVQIYNRALSRCEIELMNSELAGRWPFDEADGNLALDATGKDNHGVIIGTAREPGQPGFGGALNFGVDNDPDKHKDRVVLPHTLQHYISANMHAEDSGASANFYCSPDNGKNQLDVPSPHIISGVTADTIWADVDFEGDPADVKVWAELTDPHGNTLTIESFTYNTDKGLWEADITGLNLYGQYEITIYAQATVDGEIVSLDETTTLFQDSQQDIYEDDDSCEQAKPYDLQSHNVQRHNFHDPGDNPADQDWIKFEGEAGQHYRIEVRNADVRCDAVIELYKECQTCSLANENCELLALYDWGWAGDDETFEFEAEDDGIYYVMIRQYDEEVAGAFTGYDLRVYLPEGQVRAEFTGDVLGKINNTSTNIKNADVTVKFLKDNISKNDTTTNQYGQYKKYNIDFEFDTDALMIFKEYNYTVTADCFETYISDPPNVLIGQDGDLKTIERIINLNESKTGDLTVTLDEQRLNNIGAQWRIKGGDYSWHDMGETEYGLYRDKNGTFYDVEFKAECWQKGEEKWLLNECDKVATVNFTRKTGNLKVTIGPQGAIDNDAQWKLEGKDTTWYNSGESISLNACGQYTIVFKNDIAGWKEPEDVKNVKVPKTVSRDYSLLKGSLKVTIQPDKVNSKGALWQIDGGTWHPDDHTVDDLSPGDYTVTFKDVDGWQKPESTTITITAGEITDRTATYQPNTYAAAYGGIKNEKIISSHATTHGGLILTGWTESFGSGGRDIWLLKLDDRGEVQWQKTVGFSESDETGYSVQQTRNNENQPNGYIVAGTQSENDDLLIFKLDMAGNIGLQKRYAIAGKQGKPVIRQRKDGYILAAETTESDNTDILIIESDQNLAAISKNQYGGLRDETDPSIDLTEDGYVAACTSDSFGSGKQDIWVFKVSDNNPVGIAWQNVFTSEQDDYAPVVRKTDDGFAVAVTRNSSEEGTRSILLFKLKTSGDLQDGLPKILYETGVDHSCADLQITDDGGLIIAGNRKAGITNALTLFKADANGTLKWQRTYDNDNMNITAARAVHQTAGGLFAVTGFTVMDGYDYLVLATDKDGNIPQCNLSELQAVLGVVSVDKTATDTSLKNISAITNDTQLNTKPTNVPSHFFCKPDGQGPTIIDVTLEPTLDNCFTQSVFISAKVEAGTSSIEVWALITPPANQNLESQPVKLFLSPNNGNYEGKYIFGDSSTFGNYKITVYAKDEKGATSFPEIIWQDQRGGTDVFENDNASKDATLLIAKCDHIQKHNFHAPNDVDWVRFFAIKDSWYHIIIDNLGADCSNMKLEVYQKTVDPNNLILTATPDSDGVINKEVEAKESAWLYLKMSNPDQEDSHCDTGYDLRVSSGLKGDIDGNDKVELKDSIIGLQILTGLNPVPVNLGADVDCDNKIGMAEVIYIQEKLCSEGMDQVTE